MSELTQVHEIQLVDELQRYTKFISKFNEEIPIWIEDGRIRSEVMDPSHVSLIKWEIPSLGTMPARQVRSKEFADIIGRFSKSSMVEIESHRMEEIKLHNGTKQVHLRTIDIATREKIQDPKIPDTIEFGLTFKAFTQIVKDLRTIKAAYVTMSIQGRNLEYSAWSDIGSIADQVEIDGYVADRITSTYSMEYLEEAKILKQDMACTIATHKPLKIVVQSEFGCSKLEFWIAPRVES